MVIIRYCKSRHHAPLSHSLQHHCWPLALSFWAPDLYRHMGTVVHLILYLFFSTCDCVHSKRRKDV